MILKFLHIHLSNMLRESDLKNTGYKLPLNNKLVQYNFLKSFYIKLIVTIVILT